MDSHYVEVGGTIPGSELACEHVEWFISMMRPLLISFFIHGYKHGDADYLRRLTEQAVKAQVEFGKMVKQQGDRTSAMGKENNEEDVK